MGVMIHEAVEHVRDVEGEGEQRGLVVNEGVGVVSQLQGIVPLVLRIVTKNVPKSFPPSSKLPLRGIF